MSFPFFICVGMLGLSVDYIDLKYFESRLKGLKMIQRSADKRKGRYFIRVLLYSGTRLDPMGDEELSIFCQCGDEEPSINDVDKKRLLLWVNNNPACIKNQSNERYRISQDIDAISVIFLSDKEIQACQSADRIFH